MLRSAQFRRSTIRRIHGWLWLLAFSAACSAGPLFAQSPAPQTPRADADSRAAESWKPDAKKAKRAIAEARQAEEESRWEDAFEKYSEAFRNAPDSQSTWQAQERARFRLVQQHMDAAERELLAGRRENARRELLAALALDPNFSVAQERLLQLKTAQVQLVPQQPANESADVTLNPQPGPRSFDYRGEIIPAYEEIARQFGLVASFDQELPGKRLRFRVPDVDFWTAVNLLGQQTDTFIRPLSDKIFLVLPDTPEKRKQYDLHITRTVLLPTSGAADRMGELRNMVREIAGIANPQIDTRTRQMTLTGSPQSVALGLELIRELDQPRSEMILDIALLEVDRNAARRLGIRPPTQARAFTLTPSDIREAQASPEGFLRVLSRVFGGTGSGLSSQLSTGVINPASLIPPLIAFGGGKTVLLATLPGASAEFAETFSVLRRARRVLLRSEDNAPATLFIGERYPISYSVLTASVASPVIITGISQTDYGIGDQPVALASANFDGQTGTDLAFANFGSNTVSILFNDGSGGFRSTATLPTDPGPRAVLSADFNNDGKPDLAIAHATANTVAVILGNGDGTFTAASNFATGEQPVALAARDLTGDNRIDLLVVNEGSDSITIFPGNGDGTFGVGTNISVGSAPRAVAIIDFNGDTRPDLAVVNSGSDTVSILLGDGAGGFTFAPALATGSTPSAIAVGDFDADNLSDLVVTNRDSNTAFVFLGNGDGTFAAPSTLPTGAQPTGILAVDFTGDGRLDLAIANSDAPVISLLAGLGDGGFSTVADLRLNNAPFALLSADFNSDGRQDVATANSSGDSTTVILNAPTSTTNIAAPTGQLPYPAALYEDLGLKVRATPRIHFNREITLKLEFEIRSLSLESFNGIPVIHNRTIEQTLRAREDETTFISGVFSNEDTSDILGWPLISNLPWGGNLTSRRSRDKREVELVIAITPHRMRSGPSRDRQIYAGRGSEGGGTGGAAPPQQPPQ